MAYARKCDRCGKLYEPKSINFKKSCRVNSIRIAERGYDNSVASGQIFDLCPDCLEGFKNWFNEEREYDGGQL